MAITAQQKANLLGVTSFMFNYAPDQDSFGRFEAIIEANPSFYALGTNLARTEAYQSQFAEGITRDEKIDVILGRLGLTEGAGYETGVNFIKARLDAGIPEGQVLMEIGEKMLQDPAPAGLEEASAIFQNKIAASEAYLESGIAGYSSDTLPDLLANITADAASVEEAQAAIDAVANEGETVSLTAAGDDRFFGTENNDTFTAEAGTLQAGDQLLDQSTTDNDTLNAVITNANSNGGAGIAPTLLNIENVNLDLDVFSNAAFDAANTEGATITASSSKLGFNGEFTLNTAGDNNVVAGENVTNLIVDGLEAGTVNTGAAESASVTTVAGTDGEVANVTVNGDIELGVDTADVLNLTATADAVVDLSNVARNAATDVTEIVGSGEGVITVQGNLGGVTDITGVDTAVINTDAATNATDWDVNSISVDVDLTNGLTVADAANVTIDAEQTGLTITGQSNTGSSVNVSSNLAALGSVAFANGTLAAAELELTAAGVEVASLNANDVALTVNVAEGAEFADLNGTNNIELVGAGDVVVADADGLSSLDASNLDGALEVTTAAAAEINGAVGNNTIDFNVSANLDFVGQAGDDSVVLGGAAFKAEANLVLGAGDDTVTFEESLNAGAAVAIEFGDGNDTLVLEDSVSTANATSFSVVGLENIQLAEDGVAGPDATMAAAQLDGESFSVRGQGFDNSTLSVVETTDNGATIDLSGLDVSDSASTGASFVITGGDGDDTITGTGLADTITGGQGDDSLNGGEGEDTFTFEAHGSGTSTNGEDTITGFETADDILNFYAATTANTVNAATFVAGTAIGANDVFYNITAVDTNNDGSLSDGEAATAINSALTNFDSTNADSYFLVEFGDDTLVYEFNDGAGAGAAQTAAAADLTLIGTVEGVTGIEAANIA